MIQYSLLNSPSNYGIVKTEAVFGFGKQEAHNFVNSSIGNIPLDWMISPLTVEKRSLDDDQSTTAKPAKRKLKSKKTKSKSKRTGRKKCVVKVKDKGMKGKRKQGMKVQKKWMIPLILGLMVAKSVLIPVALKALAFISAKGFLMGFFSTILASFLSLKGMFDHHHRSDDRKDDKTQVEIIHVPPKEEHYYDEHYSRGDFVPVMAPLTPVISTIRTFKEQNAKLN